MIPERIVKQSAGPKPLQYDIVDAVRDYQSKLLAYESSAELLERALGTGRTHSYDLNALRRAKESRKIAADESLRDLKEVLRG